MRNPNRGEIWFCAVRLLNLDIASLDAAAHLGATATSLDAIAIAKPVPDPAFGLDAGGGVPIIVPDPSPSLTLSHHP
jgi:hypothetical protein